MLDFIPQHLNIPGYITVHYILSKSSVQPLIDPPTQHSFCRLHPLHCSAAADQRGVSASAQEHDILSPPLQSWMSCRICPLRHIILSEAKAPLPTQPDTRRIKLELDQRKQKSTKVHQHDPSDEEDEAPAPLEDGNVITTEKSITVTLPRTSIQYGVVQRTETWIDSTIHVSSSLIIHVTLHTILANEPSQLDLSADGNRTTVCLFYSLVPKSRLRLATQTPADLTLPNPQSEFSLPSKDLPRLVLPHLHFCRSVVCRVCCLGSFNHILSNRARLLVMSGWSLFRPFLSSHIDSFVKSLADGSYDQRVIPVHLLAGSLPEVFFHPVWMSETLLYDICSIEWNDKPEHRLFN
ncbi:hypothetical protein BLNAU_15849 [Blattamonas nauphoetae]|uniref:Uncharacterized protein n=1 Tax=Blattamonas nauphoetae TaxID=2049346 RepID=A0ABQ9XBF9_9EUKA|nr:hypothetical protein BLNAU_15849 [Blattamonas nauphoetae]